MDKFISAYKISSGLMLEKLKSASISTWFDLGIFIDRFREERSLPAALFEGSYKQWANNLENSGMAFITFMFGIDGVSIEIEKYTKVFESLFPGIQIHYMAGKFYPESRKILKKDIVKKEIPEMAGFNDWSLYKDFFFTRLERGSREYNNLIKEFWLEVIRLCEKIGNYIESNNIRLLYLVNVCSNPGNVSLALALAFISDYLGIPVINNNHDFFWEGGSRAIDIELRKAKKGPRDFFFTNSHLGEVFSLVEILYPWESRSWLNVNINKDQSKYIIIQNGHNPANVTEIGTAVDTNEYINISKRRKIDAFYQFEKILSRYKETLIGYSAADVLQNKLVTDTNPRPILIGSKTMKISRFLSENIILLQPTRIIARKRIELGLKLIRLMFKNAEFKQRLLHTPNLKITLIITGPIANGHYDYFESLLLEYSGFVNDLDDELKHKIFLAFLFSELDKEHFKEYFTDPVGIPELYNIASLVLLPSKTEGRGLPIIEATACGIPIFCRRYSPENVYSEVIGEHLPEDKRLKVMEFGGKKITKDLAEKVIRRLLFPHLYTYEVLHNKQAVNQRFSIEALTQNIDLICRSLHNQIKPNNNLEHKTKTLFDWYKKMVTFSNDDLKVLINNKKREYLPGYGRLAFMLQLKSLIDPSAFRKEEQNNRGFIHGYARYLIRSYCHRDTISFDALNNFFNAVDNIFYIRDAELGKRHDHSFSYRHRNKHNYKYYEYTLQELTGLVNILFQEFIIPRKDKHIDEVSHFFTDLDLALAQLTSSSYLAIDNRKQLIKKLQTNILFGLFPGDYIKYELEFFVLQAIRSRLKLNIETPLTSEILSINADKLKPVYVFANERSIGTWFNKAEILSYIESGIEPELKLLYDYALIHVINSKQVSAGLHFPQMGEEALSALRKIHDDNGFIIANRTHAAMMSDIVNLDRFHIGKAWHPYQANIMGISLNSGYVQFVPAGIRTTIAYPTPVQTAKSLDTLFRSRNFAKLFERFGEERLFKMIKNEVEESGSAGVDIIDKFLNRKKKNNQIIVKSINGLYDDGMPWNGVYAKCLTGEQADKWIFRTLISDTRPKTVADFIQDFQLNTGNKVLIGWNGGYILNPELVGKLGLPESYIGSPLDLIIADGEIISPPLFNKAALLIDNEGNLNIKRVNCSEGLKITIGNKTYYLSKKSYNQSHVVKDNILYYDLLYTKNTISIQNRTVIRLAGNVVKEIIKTINETSVNIIPVGLTISFPSDIFPSSVKVGEKIKLELPGYENIMHAIAAGPQLIKESKIAVDMDFEGWTHMNSIRTQAARLDYTDMRGPKIAAGLDYNKNIYILTVNGRIRESVGATHFDMAKIMLDLGITDAMGFDPGGSSTLVVENKALNISPYNKNYEKNIYSLAPQPRAVSNAIVGYIKND